MIVHTEHVERRLGIEHGVEVMLVGDGDLPQLSQYGWSRVKGMETLAAHLHRPFARAVGVAEHLLIVNEDALRRHPGEDPNVVVLHELVHASQAEAFGSRFTMMARDLETRFGYFDAPHEVEARRVAASLAAEGYIAAASSSGPYGVAGSARVTILPAAP